MQPEIISKIQYETYNIYNEKIYSGDTVLYRNGMSKKVKLEAQIDRDGVHHGNFTYYGEKNLKAVGTFNKGAIDGILRVFNNNKLVEYLELTDGELNGKYVRLTGNETSSIENYKMGVKHKTCVYDINGTIMYLMFKDGDMICDHIISSNGEKLYYKV